MEAKVYFSALNLGPTTVLKIARSSGIKRSTVYTIIEELTKSGYMRVEPHGFKNMFAAENPRTLEVELEEKKKRFRDILPVLEALYSQPEGNSVIKYYEGLDSVKGVYLSLLGELKPHDDYLVISNMETWLGPDKEFFLKWRERRSKLRVRSRLIFQTNEVGIRYKKLAPNYFETVKLLPPGRGIETALLITPKKAIIHQHTGPITALVNESKASIQLYKEMFEIIWNALPE